MTVSETRYHTPGRRPILNDSLIEEFTRALKACATVGAACQYAGVHRSTYYEWRNRGVKYDEHIANGGEPDEGEEVYLRFVMATDEALGFAEVRAASIIAKEMANDAKWAAHFLAVRNPAEWSKSTRLEHTGAGGGPILAADVTEIETRLASDLLERIRVVNEREPGELSQAPSALLRPPVTGKDVIDTEPI
jgi:hypothetical protein